MNKQEDIKPKANKSPKHWVLWTIVVIFIIGSITAMMLADYYFAPGSSGTASEPKDAAEK